MTVEARFGRRKCLPDKRWQVGKVIRLLFEHGIANIDAMIFGTGLDCARRRSNPNYFRRSIARKMRNLGIHEKARSKRCVLVDSTIERVQLLGSPHLWRRYHRAYAA